VVHLAVRWVLDQGISVALWGARRPQQLQATAGVVGWTLDEKTRAAVEQILRETITDPIGPEFMAPPQRS
jgi:aryl-alcohol dehydrogenase-like predicted oxidoreductase